MATDENVFLLHQRGTVIGTYQKRDRKTACMRLRKGDGVQKRMGVGQGTAISKIATVTEVTFYSK